MSCRTGHVCWWAWLVCWATVRDGSMGKACEGVRTVPASAKVRHDTISRTASAGSGACVEPEQAKNNPKPSPLLGPFFHTDFLAENGFFFVGLLRARRAVAAAQFLAVRSLLWRSCWCQSGLKASCCLPASSRRCREHTLTTAVREVAKLRPYLVQLFAPRFWLSY